MNSTGVNTAGTLQTYPFTGYMSEPNAQDISMAELEVEVENIDVTFNRQSKTYQVFEVDFMKKAQHLLYRISPQIQSSFDKYRVPFFIVLGVCGALVIVVVLILVLKLQMCKWLRKKLPQGNNAQVHAYNDGAINHSQNGSATGINPNIEN